MEQGYPELISYKFTKSKVFLTDLCTLKEENSLCHANFFLTYNIFKMASKWIKQKSNQKTLHIHQFPQNNDKNSTERFPYPPERGWNHGENVGKMINEFNKKQNKNHGEQFYCWLKKNIPLEKYINKQKSSSYLNYQFPKSNLFKFQAELLEIKWRPLEIGFSNNIKYHIVNLKLKKHVSN